MKSVSDAICGKRNRTHSRGGMPFSEQCDERNIETATFNLAMRDRGSHRVVGFHENTLS